MKIAAIHAEPQLTALAYSLAGPNAPYTESETKLIAEVKPADTDLVRSVRALIRAGDDPLGEVLCQLRSASDRRVTGTIYTPAPIVLNMIQWAVSERRPPARIVDPGCGSGRFTLAAARHFTKAALLAIDTDPVATLILRANAVVLGLADRLTVHCTDYRSIDLPAVDGPTLFIGNPPYVRHHNLERHWKEWFAHTAEHYGFKASKLAGLHIHFFLKTRQLARPGDYGAFITSAEWLDVNYGAVLRHMLADGLGGTALNVFSPDSMPFGKTATTGVITCFRVGNRPQQMIVRTVKSIKHLSSLGTGKTVPWSKLRKEHRWTRIIRSSAKPPPGYIELGEICSVHRGQVTGNNHVWVAGHYTGELPKAFLFPAVTKARELLAAGSILGTAEQLRRVIDLPFDLSKISTEDREQVDLFLHWARADGAHQSYIASTRRAWWSVNLRAPAPILCTYMARRPPAFVRNACGARHLNIAHGLYPRRPLTNHDLTALVAYLSNGVSTDSGRTYAGGLIKFEPKEVERIPVPRLEELHDIAYQMDNGAVKKRRRKSDGDFSARAP